MSLALYRKYRPRTFAEIIGQEHVTEPLMQALRSNRLHHAYLFSGPRGCGKTSSARILARSLNCEKGPTPTPCGECDSCRALAPDGAGSIDVIEIDAASHGGVDDARDLRERAFFAPVASRFKVYVIDEAHMVSSAGFNALLKLVEEPPEYVKFVFATTEPEKVLGTIKSRTHHYPFRLIPPGVLRPYLEQLCVTEGVAVQPAVFPLVVRAGGGSARDALSVLDQLIAGAGAEGVTYARAVALLGVTDVALIDEICDALAAGDGATAYATIDRVIEAGHDPRRFAGDLLDRLRDLIVAQQVPDAIGKGLIGGAEDELARIAGQADRFGQATLSRMADIVHTGLTDMRGTTAPRLVLELIVARMLLPGAEDSTSALLQRLERMERRLALTAGDPAADAAPATRPTPAARRAPAPDQHAESAAGPDTTPPTGPDTTPPTGPDAAAPAGYDVPVAASPAPRAGRATGTPPGGDSGISSAAATLDGATAPAATREPATPPATRQIPAAAGPAAGRGMHPAPGPDTAAAGPAAIDAAAVRRIWDEVLTTVRRKSPRAAAVVREATVREVDGSVLVLVFKHAFHAQALAAAPELLIEAIYQVLGVRWQVICEVGGQQAGGPPAVPAASAAATRTTARVAAAPVGEAADGEAADDEEDWPTPATLGGSGADAGTAARAGSATGDGAASTGTATGDDGAAGPTGSHDAGADVPKGAAADGPERTDTRADPGGGPAHLHAEASAVTPARRAAPQSARTGTGSALPPRERAAHAPAPGGGGRAAARAVAGRGAQPRRTDAGTGAARRGRSGRPGEDAWTGAGGDEPPYDPEYDGPAGGTAMPGFDPGDEPLDDVDDATARQTSEEQALDLLRQALGAEKIGESDSH